MKILFNGFSAAAETMKESRRRVDSLMVGRELRKCALMESWRHFNDQIRSSDRRFVHRREGQTNVILCFVDHGTRGPRIDSKMTTLRQFCLDDLLKFNQINLDVLTETYNGSFYMAYLSRWPESFIGERRLPLRVD